MTDRVPYHHPDDKQYSLAYVTKDKESIEADEDTFVEQYECDDEFFVLYTNSSASGTVDDISSDFDNVIDEMTPDDRVISVRFLQIFEGVIEEKEMKEGQKLDIYKQIELGAVPDAIDRVDWRETAVEVAGQIMSTLVLKHALPNANHRTSISLAEWYLESTQSGFSFPELATSDHEWRAWVDDYIAQSKQILTVRRNTTAFSLLQEWGCDTVERKGGIEIDLTDFDLEFAQSEAFEHYGEVHTTLCTDFMIESVSRAGYRELIDADGPDREDFVGFLQDSE